MAAAEELLSWGLRAVVAKQGKYGAALFTEDGFFALPAYPLAEVIDPTGAGDSFAGGFVGYVAAQRDEPIDHDLLARAMAYGTALASYNVEEFGTERVARLTADEVADARGRPAAHDALRPRAADAARLALRHPASAATTGGHRSRVMTSAAAPRTMEATAPMDGRA